MTAYLGIDTSCYTTSVAVADDACQILCNIKIPLEVASGKKGLQQSQAVFLHIKNFRRLFTENRLAEHGPFGGVCVSEKPRPQTGSYMPVFMTGTMVGEAVSSVLGVPLLLATHQEGHLSAALIGKTMPAHFLAAHVSGGTTELLEVWQKYATFKIRLLGGTRDIAAGQVIDRLAQNLELPFPGGRHIEALAENGKDLKFKVSTDGVDLNFSGLETQAVRALRTYPREDVCFSVLNSIALSLERVLKEAQQQTGCMDVLLFGGVLSNRLIRARLSAALCKIRFAEIDYSSDNAAGLAVLAAQRGGNER